MSANIKKSQRAFRCNILTLTPNPEKTYQAATVPYSSNYLSLFRHRMLNKSKHLSTSVTIFEKIMNLLLLVMLPISPLKYPESFGIKMSKADSCVCIGDTFEPFLMLGFTIHSKPK